MEKKQRDIGDEIRAGLEAQGYYIVRGHVTPERCDEIRAEFFKYLEEVAPHFKADDISSWDLKNLPPRIHGLLQHYGVGTQKHAVMARSELEPLFERFWKTDRLFTSFDGTSFAVNPYRITGRPNSLSTDTRCEGNLHLDQTSEGFSSVQAGLAVTTQGPNCRLFTCIPRSHLYHGEIMEAERKKTKPIQKDWVVLEDEILLIKHGLERVRVPLEKGDVIFWDSRLVHGSTEFQDPSPYRAYRLQVFVSMAPIPSDPKIYAQQLAKRKKYWSESRTTRHCAKIVTVFPKQPRTYGRDCSMFKTPPPFMDLTEREKQFHGLVAYPSVEEESEKETVA